MVDVTRVSDTGTTDTTKVGSKTDCICFDAADMACIQRCTTRTADTTKVGSKADCICFDAADMACIQRCTKMSMDQPKTCYQKCDDVGCHQVATPQIFNPES
ncbi:hypothetical protein T484DRAFT_1846115 [Baffinella frigidus]|nr:hypothetical protein T484DRAFT_1846115 [Cryptophyta sp. CCMP2293]